MDISRFKQQHVAILNGINDLRKLSHAGITENASQIASKLANLSQTITQHLAIEDRILYPRLEESGNDTLIALSKKFRTEMNDIANPFIMFSRKWNSITKIKEKPEEFRNEANTTLKRVFERMKQEDKDFYPVIENVLGTSDTA